MHHECYNKGGRYAWCSVVNFLSDSGTTALHFVAISIVAVFSGAFFILQISFLISVNETLS